MRTNEEAIDVYKENEAMMKEGKNQNKIKKVLSTFQYLVPRKIGKKNSRVACQNINRSDLCTCIFI